MILGSDSQFLSIKKWYSKLAILQNQICLIEVPTLSSDDKYYFATGFLINSNHVLTTYHLIEEYHNYRKRTDSINVEPIKFRFDYLFNEDKQILHGGILYESVPNDWIIDYSDYTRNYQENIDKLDYCILKIEGEPGLDKSGFQGTPRGWIEIKEKNGEIKIGGTLSILHNPDMQMMKLSINTNSIKELINNESIILHKTNTGKGSSGAPCFDINWNLIAIYRNMLMNGFEIFQFIIFGCGKDD